MSHSWHEITPRERLPKEFNLQGFSLSTTLRRLQVEFRPCPLEAVFDVCGFRVGIGENAPVEIQ
jgi:hypothetical protein